MFKLVNKIRQWRIIRHKWELLVYTVKWDLLPVIFLLLSVKCVLKYFSDNIMLKEAGQIVSEI